MGGDSSSSTAFEVGSQFTFTAIAIWPFGRQNAVNAQTKHPAFEKKKTHRGNSKGDVSPGLPRRSCRLRAGKLMQSLSRRTPARWRVIFYLLGFFQSRRDRKPRCVLRGPPSPFCHTSSTTFKEGGPFARETGVQLCVQPKNKHDPDGKLTDGPKRWKPGLDGVCPQVKHPSQGICYLRNRELYESNH